MQTFYVTYLQKTGCNSGLLIFLSVLVLLLNACGPNPGKTQADGFGVLEPALGDRAAARVNGTLITIMDIEREAAGQGLIQPGDPITEDSEIYKQILDELIDQRLLAQEAVKRNLDQDADAQNRLRIARERILGNVLVEKAVADAVTEEAIKRLYEEQVNLSEPEEEVRARHILVETKSKALEIKNLLEGGGSFAALAFEHSKDAATRLEGGDLGFFNQSSMVEPFASAAFALRPNEISGPVKTEYGWHIIKLEERRLAKPPELAIMRSRIVRFMTFDEIQKLVTELRENAKIERATDDPAQTEPSSSVEITIDGNE